MDKEGGAARAGRPKLSPDQLKRHAIAIRTTRDLADRLKSASKASGRSLAREIEYRLQRSFDDEDRVEAALNLGLKAGSQIAEAMAELDKSSLLLVGYHEATLPNHVTPVG